MTDAEVREEKKDRDRSFTFLVTVVLVAMIMMAAALVLTAQNQSTTSGLVKQVRGEAQTIKDLETIVIDLDKAELVLQGDTSIEIVDTRNELCAILEHASGLSTRYLAHKQCAEPFSPPNIQINSSGHISNKVGIPKPPTSAG